jgi:XTP/dITP diphosphohydrolase
MSLPHLPTPAGTIVESHPALDALIGVLARLRAPGGCAWDAEQTHESLTKYLIEEAHELVEAIEHGTRDDVIEELGDVLYQVLFHADIASADSDSPFTIEDVAAQSLQKMVGRHPHVFGNVVADTADEVSANWESWKAREKPARTSVLDGLPSGLPALARASAVLAKSAALAVSPGEVDVAAVEPSLDDEQALGTELLRLVAIARERGWDAERALRHAVRALEFDVRAREDEVRAAESAPA